VEEQVLRQIIREEIEPIRTLLQGHAQTLFGPKGQNGLYGDFNSMKKEVSQLKTMSRVATVLSTLGFAIGSSALGAWFRRVL